MSKVLTFPWGKGRKTWVPYDSADDRFSGFELAYPARELDQAIGFLDAIGSVEDAPTLAAQKDKLRPMLLDFFCDWKGLTPAVIAELADEWVDEGALEAMRAETAETGGEYPFSGPRFGDLLRHSPAFYFGLLAAIGEHSKRLVAERADRGNASASGPSTEEPGAISPTPSTESGTTS